MNRTYGLSKDYERLANYARKGQEVVCFSDKSFGKSQKFRDVCILSYSSEDRYEYYQISSRGTCYVRANYEDDFIARCNLQNIEFISPNYVAPPRYAIMNRNLDGYTYNSKYLSDIVEVYDRYKAYHLKKDSTMYGYVLVDTHMNHKIIADHLNNFNYNIAKIGEK